MGRRRPRRRRTAADLPLRLAHEIHERLERIHAELLKRRSLEPAEADVDISLGTLLHADDREAASRAFASGLIGALEESVAQRLAATVPFVLGRVYCYWCESASCAHAGPPGPRFVFAGYDPTGLPVWEELVSLCLRLNDRRVDQLHRTPPEPLSIFMPGSMLHGNQLAIFGATSHIFRIVCQSVVGYFPASDETGAAKTALTLQAVESQTGGRRADLALNVVGRSATGEEFWEAAERNSDRRIADLFDTGRRRIKLLGAQRPDGRRAQELAGLVKHLAAGVERICRQGARRTKHAQLRHRDPSRPTANAVSDTAHARDEDFFFDRRRGTFVVIGPRGRAHVFNAEGRHVTSMVCRGEDVESRTRTRQWVPLEPPACQAFRAKVRGDDGAARA